MLTFIAGVVAGLVLAVAKPLWALAVNAFVVKVYNAIRENSVADYNWDARMAEPANHRPSRSLKQARKAACPARKRNRY